MKGPERTRKGCERPVRIPLSVLAERYGDKVYAAAFSVCRNLHDAQDIAQETFLSYHTTKKEFASEEHILAWLLRVAVNKSKNLCRSAHKQRDLPLEDWEQTLVFAEAADRELFQAVLALPEPYRVVLHLHYYEGYSVKEIAKLLRVGESAVKQRLARARAQLKELYQED